MATVRVVNPNFLSAFHVLLSSSAWIGGACKSQLLACYPKTHIKYIFQSLPTLEYNYIIQRNKLVLLTLIQHLLRELQKPSIVVLGISIISRSSRFARLQGIQCALVGRNLYILFTCRTGDAMGMNMVSKGVQNVLDFLQTDFPDMEVIGISG